MFIARILGLNLTIFLAIIALPSCTTNLATGKSDFTLFMSKEMEVQIGAQEHPKLIARFGGVYDDVEAGGYVAEIGGRIVANSEMPNYPFTFTVLNTPEVNAFALPGGYIYVTRGLMALANSEAELAGVLAHEIGHVVARHTAQRYSRAVAGGIGGAIIGIALNSNSLGNLAQLGSELYLAKFSREQEYESDTLGIRYMQQAGYSSVGMTDFLQQLIRERALRSSLRDQKVSDTDFFSTHPRTPDRVRNARAVAGDNRGAIRKDHYLNQISGILFGDDPSQGLIRGRRFIHPDLGFEFTVPPDFRIINTANAVFAKHQNTALIIFDIAPRNESHPDPLMHLTQIWAPDLSLQNLERIDVNGQSGATGAARVSGRIDKYRGPVDVRFVVVQFPRNHLMRFLFLTPVSKTPLLRKHFERVTFSLKRFSQAGSQEVKPYRIGTVQVGSKDTVTSLAARMSLLQGRLETFRVLNGLGPEEKVNPGQRVKLVVY